MTFDDDVKPITSEREILERVHRRGRALRRRRYAARALSALTVALLVLASSLALGHQFGGSRSTHGSFVSDAVTPDDSLVRPMADVTDSPTPTPSDTPTEEPSPSVSTAPMLVCLNSYDPACGDFSWITPPGPNAPLTATVTASPSVAEIGQLVTVHVTATDPDAPIHCSSFYWGDEPYESSWAVLLRAEYGPWETPAKEPGEFSATYTHTYSNAGTFRISFDAGSGACRSNPFNPYTSEGSDSFNITITDATAPSPSVSPSPSGSPSPSPSAT